MRLWIIAAMIAFCGLVPANAAVEINVKDGDTLQKIFKVEVTVQSDSPVMRVEFLINDRLREVDQSTPYEFEWDTISDAEGEHTLTVNAKLENEKTESKSIKIRIDNEVGKGAEHHFQQARDLFSESNWKDALISARIALKAQSDHKPARVLLMQTYMRQGNLEAAEDAVEDFNRIFPESPEGYQFQAQIALRKARTARDERRQIETAIAARRKVLDIEQKALDTEQATTENLAKQAHIAMIRGDYERASQLFFACSQQEENNLSYRNRLAQAYLLSGRYQDVLVATGAATRRGTADAYTYGIQALAQTLLNRQRDFETSMRAAEQKDKENPKLHVIQAGLEMRNRKISQAARLAVMAQNEGLNAPQASFIRMWSFSSAREFDRAREHFWQTLDLELLTPEAYVMRGMESLAESVRPGNEEMTETARAWFDLALTARPTYAPAQIMKAVSFAFELNFAKRDGESQDEETRKQALTLLDAGARQLKDSAWMQLVTAFVYEQTGRSADADKALARATQMDTERVTIGRIPDPNRMLEFLQQFLFFPIAPNP